MLLQTQRAIDQVVFTCCILHNIILEADGLDARWEQQVEWDTLNPQVGNSDEGYDEDGTVDVTNICLQERRILERVGNYVRAIYEVNDGNEIEAELDANFEMKRNSLISHFKKAYDSGLVSWPRGFTVKKKNCYRLGR